ncbi:S9 family peptidase [Promicromonospora iranensis]|uniref:Dipeptidyl aminopeptidase/acylaminoacyl peptidase n=1 Tax=Promicromonospora iranensis TaxID=1105144 RepID=A0ABU2CGX7_9MICO|nr:alpha/beta fold hydrolase [Promicromonospora iranensis]MDR7380590.1 dipeptidyl aminopeptidase/acylaminoacyl peptidase [Promicromonospora iranensis]
MTSAPSTSVPEIVNALLDLTAWAVLDVDPEGRILAGNDEPGSMQLVEIAPDGTRTQLTALPSRCSGRYVPGTRRVVVQHDNGGDEKTQLSLLDLAPSDATVASLPTGPALPDVRPAASSLPARLPATLETLAPLVHDPEHKHDLADVSADSVVFLTNRRDGVDFDLVVHDLATGTETTLYDGGGYLSAAAASHDRRSVAITVLSSQPRSTQILVAGDGGDSAAALTAPDEHAHHAQVAWTADDDALVMASDHDREFAAVVRVRPGEANSPENTVWQTLVEADDHDLEVALSPDGTAMIVGHHQDGVTTLAVHEPDGTHRCDVTLPDAGVPTVVWAPDSSRFAVHLTTPGDPGSIHLVDAATGTATTVVDGRDQVPAGLPVALPTVHRVPTPDGEQVPCFVYRPVPATTSTSTGPALTGASVLLIHGGPEGEATRLFSPVIQALAATGFTVLVPNVRGSAGYGKRWVSLDDVHQRLDSVADLAALHAWLPELGLDPERSALWGGSYGGYMVLAGTTMQPDLWAAGVDIVGMSSLVTFLENTSEYRRAAREREYGSLEHDRDFLLTASPITYLDQLRAPLFVIHGANDPRVPLSEAEQIAAALADRGVRHELRVYVDEGHGLAQRANRKDAYPAAIEFLAEVLGGTEVLGSTGTPGSTGNAGGDE